MQETARLITAEEFETVPGHDHHYETPPISFDREDDVIDLDDAVPRFRCTVGEILE